jgi:S-methylmethionine-dependent homocysteine/selenocysteine methylase
MADEIKTQTYKNIFQEYSQKSAKILGCCCYLLGVNLTNCMRDHLIKIFEVISFH